MRMGEGSFTEASNLSGTARVKKMPPLSQHALTVNSFSGGWDLMDPPLFRMECG